jgi:hypothetical protein
MAGQPQQINVSDLELPQLADVRKQLDDVLKSVLGYRDSPVLISPAGAHAPYEFIRAAQAGAIKIRIL